MRAVSAGSGAGIVQRPAT